MFWENFVNLCNSVGKSPNGIAKDINVSSGAITSWKKGKVPHHSTLLKIANYFNVSVDYLLTGIKEKPASIDADGDTDDWTSPELIKLIKELPETEQSKLEDYVRYLHAKTIKKESQ